MLKYSLQIETEFKRKMRIPHNFWGFKFLSLMKCGVKNLKKLVSVLVSVHVAVSLSLRVDGQEGLVSIEEAQTPVTYS